MYHAVLAVVSNCCPPLKGRFLTRYSPVRHCPLLHLDESSIHRFSFDLHVLSTPPAFVLSQDQTLNKMVSHIWCFFVLRCLIYKVHAPTAERILGYHNFPALSTLFLCFCSFSSLATEEGKPLSESRPLFANRSYLSTPPELLQVLILYFSFFGQTAQSESLISVITAKNSRREAGKALLPPNI